MSLINLSVSWKTAFETQEWPMLPSDPEMTWTEHKFTFVDAVFRASSKIFKLSRDSLARDLYLHPDVSYLVESLPNFRDGILNEFWTVRYDDTILPKNHALVVGSGGSVRIQITGNDS
jgi:hypothetical protein